jgi:hypothetical protein
VENILVGKDVSVCIGFCTSAAVKRIGRKGVVADIREMRYNGAISCSGVSAEPGCVAGCRGSVRTGIGKRSTCVVLSSRSSRNEQGLLGGVAAIKSSTFHEGTACHCQLPRNFCSMRIHISEESRYRRVGVDNIEGFPREDIVTSCSRGSKVVRITN